VREHRTFLGCWICWEHEGVWAGEFEPADWWVHLEGHFAVPGTPRTRNSEERSRRESINGGEGSGNAVKMGACGYRICVGESGWMNKFVDISKDIADI